MTKKDFTAQAKQDIHSLGATHRDEEQKKGVRVGTRGLTGARMIVIERLKIDPDQPRKTLSPESIRELAESIREYGILQPINVIYIPNGDYFQIINGERRYRAALLAGQKEVPCIIKEARDDEKLLQQLIENLQREDLTPLEEAEGLKALIDRFGYTQQGMASVLGKSKSSISETVSLIKLPEEVKAEVRTSELFPKSVLLQIVREPNIERKWDLWQRIKNEDLTVRETRKEARKGKPQKGIKPFSYKFSPKDRSYTLHIKFRKSSVAKQELIDTLREVVHRLEQDHDMA